MQNKTNQVNFAINPKQVHITQKKKEKINLKRTLNHIRNTIAFSNHMIHPSLKTRKFL